MRVCAFPGCGNVMRRYLCLSFHRLPYRNRQTLPLWLVALHLDPKTPLKTLREKDHRVCSVHFDEDEFTEKGVKCRHLKANAIPKAKCPAADTEVCRNHLLSHSMVFGVNRYASYIECSVILGAFIFLNMVLNNHRLCGLLILYNVVVVNVIFTNVELPPSKGDGGDGCAYGSADVSRCHKPHTPAP